jgi:hypothetical protein
LTSQFGRQKPHREPVKARPSTPRGAVNMTLSEVVALDIGFHRQSIKTKRLEDRLMSEASAIFKPFLMMSPET